MSISILNFFYFFLYLFFFFFLLNIIKTRVYIYLVLNFFVYIVLISFVFYYLHFELIAFLLILVYAGAVVILFTFVVMLYENHKLLYISSSFFVLFILYVSTTFFFFFILYETETEEQSSSDVDAENVKHDLQGHHVSEEVEQSITDLAKDTLDMEFYLYYFKRFLLSEDNNFFDVYEPNTDAIKDLKNVDYLTLYYNYFDATTFYGVRVPYYGAQIPNITINDLDMDYFTSFIYFNKPLQIVDPYSKNSFIFDDKLFDVFYMYSRFVFELNDCWNLDLYSLFMYFEHFINKGNKGCEPYRVLPEAMDIRYDIVHIELFYDDFHVTDPWYIYNTTFYDLNDIVTECFQLNPWEFLDGESVMSFNNIFRAFDEISLLHTYESILYDFSYLYTTSENLFNTLGLYLYCNCLFEFMIIGLMLFICLICIMRLLKTTN